MFNGAALKVPKRVCKRMTYQTTLSGPALCAGVGLHTGERARLAFKPAEANTGIVFVRTDVSSAERVIIADGRHVTTTQLGTTLANEDGVSVSTVEHLVAACAGVGLDNVIVEIDGPEVPIMDGSSTLYCQLLMQAGLRQLPALRRRIRILKPVEVRDGGKYARLVPSEVAGGPMEMRIRIDFPSAAIGEQVCRFTLSPGAFSESLAFARTFGFANDVEKLQAMGLARGGSMENAIVLDGDNILNPEGLRADDEFVRHKMLDAVGDLHLAGAFIEGIFEADQPGHAINNRLVRALFDNRDAWEWTTDRPASQVRAAAARVSSGPVARAQI